MQLFAKGDRGNEVVDIQVKLSALGYDLGADGADGSFGENTEHAVKDFQRNRGLNPIGIVNSETWRALVEATYELGDRLLYLRTPFFRGDDVKELQLALNTLGFNTGRVDGIYGHTTERAVREFQLNYGLTRDGIFGPSALASLRNLRHILSGSMSLVFPDPERDRPSAISVFRDKKIAIELGLNDEALLSEDDGENIIYDFGIRLGNLLELLGAEVLYIGNASSAVLDFTDTEIWIAFGLNASEDISRKGSSVYFYKNTAEIEEKSRMLAKLVQHEIIQSLGSKDCGIAECAVEPRLSVIAPAVMVKPLYSTNPEEKNLLRAEIFRQKIAVAVFDGISYYLRKR